MKTKDEVVALAKAHGAYLHDESARLVFDYERLPAFAAACTLTHEQAYAIQTKAYFEACRISPEDRLQGFAAAPITVTQQEVELAVQDYCLGVADNNEAMRHALEAFIARKGNPK